MTTHALAYKSSQVDWRYLRLAAQLRAAIEQLDQLVHGFEESALFITEQNWPDVQAKKMFVEHFSKYFISGSLPSEAKPDNWSRFSENLLRVCRSCSDEYKHDIVRCASRAIKVIDSQVNKSEGDCFLRSISLLRFCIGALVTGGFATKFSKCYTPLITQELVDLYPAVKMIGQSFELEDVIDQAEQRISNT